ncbi:MAG: pilus assembly protein [Candidatus Obscuribacterales bacterium]|nr:pilus assembly protein [Candidatus Obscuribacterales bacterium]
MKKFRYKGRGLVLAETAASMMILIPLMMVIVFVVWEVSQAYFLKASLAQVARQAARDLAITYGRNPDVATNRSLQESLVLNHISLNGVVVDPSQFSSVVFQTDLVPHTVTVRVQYSSGLFGLAAFPGPDPLHLGKGFLLTADSTYRLE